MQPGLFKRLVICETNQKASQNDFITLPPSSVFTSADRCFQLQVKAPRGGHAALCRALKY